jgi:hypothetical protein
VGFCTLELHAYEICNYCITSLTELTLLFRAYFRMASVNSHIVFIYIQTYGCASCHTRGFTQQCPSKKKRGDKERSSKYTKGKKKVETIKVDCLEYEAW